MRLLVLALVVSVASAASLTGCASSDSDRAYGLRGSQDANTQAGSYQASYPKSPINGTHDRAQSYDR